MMINAYVKVIFIANTKTKLNCFWYKQLGINCFGRICYRTCLKSWKQLMNNIISCFY